MYITWFSMGKSARLPGCQPRNILLIAFMTMTKTSLVLHFFFPSRDKDAVCLRRWIESKYTCIQPRRLWLEGGGEHTKDGLGSILV